MTIVPSTMRAAVLRQAGEPLHIETLATPRPKAGEVLLKVLGCGLCHSDLHVITGAISFPTPAVPGHEVSGQIVQLGEGLDNSGIKLGQKVAASFIMPCGQCDACRAGRDDLCRPFFDMNRLNGTLYDGETRIFTTDGHPIAMYSEGGFAQYCVVPATAITPIPDSLDPVNASIIGCAAMTAYGAVRRGADLRYGESVAVVATGGVGSTIVQIAKAFGAYPLIAIDVSDDKLEEARALGADFTINSTTENVRAKAFEYTDGTGVQVAFEALGIPTTWTSALDALADGGRMVPIGLGAGIQTAPVEINRTVRRSQSIHASYGARTRQDLPAVVRMAARGVVAIDKVVTQKFSLDQINQGYDLLKRGKILGRGVIDMSL